MTSPDHPACRASTLRLLPAALALVLGLGVAADGRAQFKVTGADGKVTYTDREPAQAEGRVTSLGARAPVQAAEPELPFELRQTTAKYPVTLYTITGACQPCTSARQLLRQRGIPFDERHIISGEDSEALEKLSGAREAPTLTIGSQVLRGLAVEVWHSYLDAAGYPRDSRLPSSYQYRPATPLVERREPAQRTAPAPTTAATRSAAPTAGTNAGMNAATSAGTAGIRF
jgi:glutaredoxin